MMIIKIQNLRLKSKIGVYDWEKDFEREIVINLEIATDDLSSLVSDDLRDTIDYDKIYQIVKFHVAKSRFNLIEKMAATILAEIMSDKRIAVAKIEIRKMNVFEDVESFAIFLEHQRS